jgi:hypothetical protein
MEQLYPATLWLNIPWQGRGILKPSVWQMRDQLPHNEVCGNRTIQVHSETHTVHDSPNFDTVQVTRLEPHRFTFHTFPQLDLAVHKTHISFRTDVQNHLLCCCTKPSAYQRDILKSRVRIQDQWHSQKLIHSIHFHFISFY